jgi:hypothetical protein
MARKVGSGLSHITLTEDQARLIVGKPGEVEVRDPAGRLIGFLSWSDERSVVERAKRTLASNQRRSPSHVVQARLRKLAEAVERDGLDYEAAKEFMKRLRDEEQA